MSQQPEKTREDSFREARKQIVRSAFLALAALGVIVFACYAWFVSSGTVTGKISSVLLNGSTFELASVGEKGAFYDQMRSELKKDKPDTWSYTDQNGMNQNGISTGKYDTVEWLLTDNSNLGNNTEAGIQPGSEGEISFFVIPKTSGDIKLKFHIELIPLEYPPVNAQDKTLLPIADTVLEKLLSGHFLFYWEENGEKTWVPCKTGEFTMTFSQCNIDTPIPVTLNWKWPLLLQHIKNETGIKDEINENAVFFFFPSDQIPNPINLDSNSIQLSKLFNNADQYIGERLDWLEVRLSAQMIS